MVIDYFILFYIEAILSREVHFSLQYAHNENQRLFRNSYSSQRVTAMPLFNLRASLLLRTTSVIAVIIGDNRLFHSCFYSRRDNSNLQKSGVFVYQRPSKLSGEYRDFNDDCLESAKYLMISQLQKIEELSSTRVMARFTCSIF